MKNTLSKSALKDVTHATLHALEQKGIVLSDNGACGLNDAISSFLVEQQAISIARDDARLDVVQSVNLSFSVSMTYEHIEGGNVDIPDMRRRFKDGLDEARQNGAFSDEFTAATDLFVVASEK